MSTEFLATTASTGRVDVGVADRGVSTVIGEALTVVDAGLLHGA